MNTKVFFLILTTFIAACGNEGSDTSTSESGLANQVGGGQPAARGIDSATLCRLKASGDITATSFRLQLTSAGETAYGSLLNNYRKCEATNMNCVAKASGDITVENFRMQLTSSGESRYRNLFEAYKGCP